MAPPKEKRKRIDLTLEQNIDVINEYDKNKSQRVTAEKHGIGKSTVGDILKERDQLLKLFAENKSLSQCRIHRNLDQKLQEIDLLTWEWFTMVRSVNIPISGPLIQEQARYFAKELSIDDFKASNGWLEKWKSRHNVAVRYIIIDLYKAKFFHLYYIANL